MSYKTLLTVLDNPGNTRIAADFVAALAKEHDACVVGLHAEIVSTVPLVAPMEIPDPVAVQALQDAAHHQAVEIERLFRAKMESAGLDYEWHSFASTSGYGTEPLIESARSADLLVAVQPDPSKYGDSQVDVETFLFDSGRPVLLIPYILTAPKPIRRVLIAWNGSKEAARATFDALPFLKAADSVEILSVSTSEKESHPSRETGVRIAAALTRHGVRAKFVTAACTGKSTPSQVIENRLADDSIDLLVMGAYTHSWLWQMIFGGTTRTLLQSMTAITLLAR
ncbi:MULTISPECIES: universal stress protein [unclassified Rhizobium]|uniref:universal stress protein n=1 Tax=unclassified Rhizobium TaxID=2613769 RepID=UPI00161ECC80|nr:MULTISPECIES: universal stress protein [unclassified Rhizobium]MBB3288998.1 nucleotide-binding universal stress UspA family protein [Rhizobium sp. BK252]MBB3403740.1 nucleotide-binding universal stress UspA family protein [Rhizobium sp. BK289]MBB3416074.1 nucleotide-binding universal stress UspA family protein [Rhizobium sp. BK284]MBB3484203.1 nucleotide-binding universal stress UspA family protein [Rhizobium sp. BK347]MDK4720049.1 universal stress protein [Rhizobium sp. CNPSo 3968]